MEIDKIYCGDNATALAEFPDGCIDLTVTSPPYDALRDYKGCSWNFEEVARQLYRVTKVGGVVVWVVGDATVNGSETGSSFRQALYFMECGFNLHDTMIFEANKQPLNGNRYEPKFEFMFILTKGAPRTFNPILEKSEYGGKTARGRTKYKSDGSKENFYGNGKIGDTKVKGNIWFFAVGMNGSTNDKIDHPAIFPESLANDHILSWSNPGDVILDPFCGSGTTLKMAKQLGRHWIGIDIADEYCRLSQKRIDGANVPIPGFDTLVPPLSKAPPVGDARR